MSERKTFLLRISRELWHELERMAAEEFRSVNGQIEYLLRQAVVGRRRRLPPEAEGEPDPQPGLIEGDAGPG